MNLMGVVQKLNIFTPLVDLQNHRIIDVIICSTIVFLRLKNIKGPKHTANKATQSLYADILLIVVTPGKHWVSSVSQVSFHPIEQFASAGLYTLKYINNIP